jgi:two-component system KDP operon response regulator KdpE
MAAINALKHRIPDLVLLDIAMPGLSGIDVCLWLRTQSDIPVIVLSAHDEEDLMVRALDAGADDYVLKPFAYDVLLARIRAAMRRSEKTSREDSEPIVIGELVIDLEARRTFLGGAEIPLTNTEFALLSELARNLDKALRHEELLARVWGPEYRDESHYLYIYLGRIRDKLGAKYGALIETVPGVGYLMHAGLE